MQCKKSTFCAGSPESSARISWGWAPCWVPGRFRVSMAGQRVMEVPEAVQVMNTSTSDWHCWPGGVSNWENDQGPPPFKLCSLVARRARVQHWRSSSFSVGEPHDLETYGPPMLRLHEFNVKSRSLGSAGFFTEVQMLLFELLFLPFCCHTMHTCPRVSRLTGVCTSLGADRPQLPSHSGGDLVLLAQTWSRCCIKLQDDTCEHQFNTIVRMILCGPNEIFTFEQL